jgi:hypothetical protein
MLEEPMLRNPRWYADAYRRAVIDMHIPDWDERFLARFDAREYAERLVRSRAQSIVAYAHSHVGLFNYPTKVGKQHAGQNGRNVLKEMIDACHARNIAVVLYTSLIFDRWAADQHPDWRMRTWDGKIQGEGGRHGVLCPNSPYREYARSFTEELCRGFDFEGIRFDMTFWPSVCYCGHCRRRFADEVGGELPTTVDWLDERWVAFQRKREEWLVEFAALITGTVRRLKPAASVEHQSSTFPLDWVFGVTEPLAAQTDFLQGDFYGDALQGSFVRKLLEDLTPNRPVGFETSAAVELRDHTTIKPEALLEAKASAAIADHAAFVFIDAIDPAGTVNPLPHERMGRVFDRLKEYYPHLGGARVRDVGVYFSARSKFSFAGSGRPVGAPDRTNAQTDSLVAVCRALSGEHIPFGVVTSGSLRRLSGVKVLVLSGLNVMDEQEARLIREWVRAGGRLYASGAASLVDPRGRQGPDFMLADVFGVSLRRIQWQPREHYVAPTPAGQTFFGTFDPQYPAFITSPILELTASPDASVLATTTLPWPAPDPSRFSSIHSNPPWERTDRPEVVRRRFGHGEVIYCASPIETVPALSETFVALLRALHGPFTLEAEAPICVEATLFHQPERHRYVLALVNFQKDLPNVPVTDVRLRLRLPERVRRVTRLPSGSAVRHPSEDGVVTLTVSRVETLAMLAVETA